jgi:hypothetical protein
MLDEIHGKLHQADFPPLVDPLDEGIHGIVIPSQLLSQPVNDVILVFTEDILRVIRFAKGKPIAKKMEVFLFLHPSGEVTGFVAESLQDQFAHVLRGKNPGPFGMDHPLTETNCPNFVHRLSD